MRAFGVAQYVHADGSFQVPKDKLDVDAIVDDEDKTKIIEAINRAITKGTLTFEGFLKQLNWDVTERWFLRLAQLTPGDVLDKRKSTCDVKATYDSDFMIMLICLKHVNKSFNMASELFQRDERVRVEVDGYSLYSLWKSPDRVRLWLDRLRSMLGPKKKPSPILLSSYMLRKCMTGHKAYATQFPPIAAKGVYYFLRSEHVLDPCFGWGDRFAAAYATKGVKSFHGIDPRAGAQKGFTQQMDMYRAWLPNRKLLATFTKDKAQNVKLPVKAYDTIFTSPPFYNKEQYKSLGTFRNINHWFDTFLEPFIDNMWRSLAVGGSLALHLDDDIKRPISNRMNMYIGTQSKAEYQGIICMPRHQRSHSKGRGEDDNEPIWVWKKA